MPEGASRGAPDLSLVYADAQGKPRIFTIPEGTTTLGSAPDNDLVIDDPSVTAHQVVVMRRGDTVELRDLFSGETKVNDAPRRAGKLDTGDVLTLGAVRLRVMKVVSRRTGAQPRIVAAAPAAEAGQQPSTRAHNRPTGMFSREAVESGRAQRDTPMRTSPPSSIHSRPTRAHDPAKIANAGVETSKDAVKRDTAGAPERPADRATARTDRVAQPGAGSVADELKATLERRERTLARARQLSDEMLVPDDFEVLLERIAIAFLDIFAADRAVTVLFEEDGRNPLLTVERRRDGTDEGAGVAQEIVDRVLQVRSVVRIAGGHQGLGGLAAPLITKGKALGLLYFERTTVSGPPLDASDVHLMAMITNEAALVIAPLVN